MKRLRTKRKNEKWVSNNRVLLGSSKKDPGRNPNFDTEETKLLISLWGDPTIQKTLITTHRKHTVIAKLAEQMNEYGYHRSTEEINTRIKNLKCFYNRLKKDMDTGSINGVTWKHFAAMDEIMTRSIFSVRPNEIPKPSLKYQLEQELEEKWKKTRNEASTPHTVQSLKSSFQILDENLSCSSISSKEINDSNCDKNTECIEKTEIFCNVKEDHCVNLFKTECEEQLLRITKEEQINDDDLYIETDETCKHFNKSFDYENSSNNINSISKVTCKTTNTTTSTVAQSNVFTNSATKGISVPQKGKISLVPTNFLIQQNKTQSQSKQIQLQPHPQQKIICAKPNSQPNQKEIVSSPNNGRMKVLFVNAFKNGNTQNVSTNIEFPLSNSSIINATNTQATETTIPMTFVDHQEQPRAEETAISSKEYGLELLINKLIDSQNKNNEIQRQRLELNKKRLEFEKSIANKLLEAITSMCSFQSQENDVNLNTTKSNENPAKEIVKSAASEIIDDLNNYSLLTPKIERMD